MKTPRHYSDLRVSWCEHARRGLTGLIVPDTKPWHLHLYRAWRSFCGDIRYAPPGKSGSLTAVERHFATELMVVANGAFEFGPASAAVSLPRAPSVIVSPAGNRLSASVIINTYNRCDCLEATLEALRRLRHPCFEVIVVNGPSTDGTAALLEKSADWLRFALCPEANLARSRNIGLSMARGEIVCYLDDDAVPEPGWLDELEKTYGESGADAVGAFTRDHTGRGFQAKVVVCDEFADPMFFEDMDSARAALAGKPGRFISVMGGNCSYRKRALMDVGGFDENYAYYLEETDIARRLTDAGRRIVYARAAEAHHKYAPSHLRGVAKAPKTLILVCRSKAYYCALWARSHPLPEIISYLARWASAERKKLGEHCRAGRLNRTARMRLEDEILSGMKEGIRLACSNRADRFFSGPGDSGTLIPVSGSLPTDKRLRLCFVAKAFRAGGLPGYAASQGHEVTVITGGDGPCRVDFVSGLWLHRMGRLEFPYRDEVSRVREIRGIRLVLSEAGDGAWSPDTNVCDEETFRRFAETTAAYEKQ